MPYSMFRTKDDAGDSGSMSDAYHWPNGQDDGGYPEIIHDSKPFVGAIMRVGSVNSRSYSNQDWWQTTMITEIIEEWTDDDGEHVKFKTGNSIYLWKKW